MNGSIFLDSEGNEVEIITWGKSYVHYIYTGSKLCCFTPKEKFLKKFNPKDEE